MEHGKLPLLDKAAIDVPWWFALIANQERHIQSILEATAFDCEKLSAPRDLWPITKSKELKEWFDEREKFRQTKERLRSLEDY